VALERCEQTLNVSNGNGNLSHKGGRGRFGRGSDRWPFNHILWNQALTQGSGIAGHTHEHTPGAPWCSGEPNIGANEKALMSDVVIATYDSTTDTAPIPSIARTLAHLE
jgi:hypothetical protein